jgi:hypothetical protein
MPSESGRAVIAGLMVGASNSAGIVSSLSFTSASVPKYLPANVVTAVSAGIGTVLALGLGAYFRWDNRRRDREQGTVVELKDVATGSLVDGTRYLNWRWTA